MLYIIEATAELVGLAQRHSTATLADVGTPKVTCCAEYFKSVAPWVVIDPRVALFEKGRAAELLEGSLLSSVSENYSSHFPRWHVGKPDFVIDCIDNIESKVNFLGHALSHG